ncbi:nucleolar zinc-finger protein [Arachnomyces sp. PD_36]|nr:nucleolar zinc-finger protein [Arachnomyces sp. PD_36]
MTTSSTESNPPPVIAMEEPSASAKKEYLRTPIPADLNKKVKALALDDDEDRENTVDDDGNLIEKKEEDGDGFQDGNEVIELQSLCMACHEDGVTRLLLLKVPYFRSIMLESFECPHCYHKNNSVKSALQIQPQGAKYTLVLDNKQDLDRQVIKSDSAIFNLESLGIEMPKGEGQLTNVEGVLAKILTALESEQPQRKKTDPELHAALDERIQKLIKMMNGCSFPFTVTLDDPAGNSWIAPSPENEGEKYKRHDYNRTAEQNEELGISVKDEDAEGTETETAGAAGEPEDLDIVDGQVYSLPSECPACMKHCIVNMQKINVPHFKEVFVWSTVCDHCGHRTSDVKTGGAIPEKGRRIVAKIENEIDLSRDILKSDSCVLSSEELELSVQPGTLGGRFTTIEGLLTQIRDQLHGQIFDAENLDLEASDSMTVDYKSKWVRFFDRLDSAIKGELKFSMTLEDPLANSYVQDLFSPEPDPQLKIEDYTRTDEEDDDLGLKDMKTEGYEEEHQAFLERERAKEAEDAADEATTST